MLRNTIYLFTFHPNTFIMLLLKFNCVGGKYHIVFLSRRGDVVGRFIWPVF